MTPLRYDTGTDSSGAGKAGKDSCQQGLPGRPSEGTRCHEQRGGAASASGRPYGAGCSQAAGNFCCTLPGQEAGRHNSKCQPALPGWNIIVATSSDFVEEICWCHTWFYITSSCFQKIHKPFMSSNPYQGGNVLVSSAAAGSKLVKTVCMFIFTISFDLFQEAAHLKCDQL